MPWFEGTHSETRTVSGSPDAVAKHFADPATVVKHTKGVESADIDGEAISFVMEEENHGVVVFQGRFTCRYTLGDDGVLRWSTDDGGNMVQEGEARFTEADGGTEVAYTETVKLDLDVPGMMAPMIQPVIGAMVGSEIKGYLDRVTADL